MPLIERRRIYAAGHSLAITLPKWWLAYYGLKAGDSVQFLADGIITVSPSPPVESRGMNNEKVQQ